MIKYLIKLPVRICRYRESAGATIYSRSLISPGAYPHRILPDKGIFRQSFGFFGNIACPVAFLFSSMAYEVSPHSCEIAPSQKEVQLDLIFSLLPMFESNHMIVYSLLYPLDSAKKNYVPSLNP